MEGKLVAKLLEKWQKGDAMTDDELSTLHKGLTFIWDFMRGSKQDVIGSYYFNVHRSVEFAINSRLILASR